MLRPAKILLAGTLIATGLCGAATSQSVINEQIQLGDVFAEHDLDVVEVDEGVQQTTSASGNTLMGSVENADVDIVSNQTMSGGSLGRTDVTVSDALGDSSTVSTAAIGNSGDASIVQGTMTGVFNQLNNGSGQTARSWIEGGDATAGDITSNTQAVGNSQGLGLTNGSVGARFAQENEASASAEAGVVLLYTPGESVVTTTAAGNNATSVGVDQSAQRLDISQNNLGASTNAESQAYYGNSYLTTTSATASGNNTNVTNEGPLLDVTTTQNNESEIAAESYATSYDFGAASSLAYGVGNSVMAGNAGTEIVLDNTQNNDAAVAAVSSFGGHNGYDALTSATAMGNAVTGYACAYCDGTMTVRNQQTNGSTVSAQSGMTLTGSARSVIGLTTAVGNNASFYVSHPSE